VCHFKYVCLGEGNLIYFRDPSLESVSNEFFPDGFPDSKMFHTGFVSILSGPTIKTVIYRNKSYQLDSHIVVNKTGYVDVESFSENPIHYLLDNVIPHFAASRIFNLSFEHGIQVFEGKSRSFSNCTFNKNTDNSSELCNNRLLDDWRYFMNNPPIFLEEQNMVCFNDLVAGIILLYFK
jgi:hypothetical protein